MKKLKSEIVKINWFFVSAVIFTLCLPFSQALVSISSGILLFMAIAEDSWKNKIERIKNNRILFFIISIYGLYLVSAILSGNISDSFYDLRKTLFFLVIPMAFILGKPISNAQKGFLLYSFSFALIVATFIALVRWSNSQEYSNFEVHKASLISHIRFSFQILLAFWFFILHFQKNKEELSRNTRILFLVPAAYFLGFIFFQQSLTGLIALGGSIVFYIFILLIKVKHRIRNVLLFAGILFVISPLIYVIGCVKIFYDFDKIDQNNLPALTKSGNPYSYDFSSKMVENGHYVYLFVCEKEMREEWNKISEHKFDSIGKNGFPVHSTLVRYLTSKDLKKDSEGIKALNEKDIKNIENGIANSIYSDRKLSIYPRIYQTIWEYYVYTHTGYVNYQSFSQRIIYGKTALSIIKKHFWFGVGTAKWKDAFSAEYKLNFPQLNNNLYGSSHNQYLNYMVKFGFAGFILIMFFIIYPIIQRQKYHETLFLIFLIFMFIANFADSNFESHMGGAFFVFFYCFFITSENDGYFVSKQISWKMFFH